MVHEGFGEEVSGKEFIRLHVVAGRRARDHLPTSEWHQFIPRPAAYVYTVRFSGVADCSALSEAELAVLDEIFAAHRDKSEWELVDFTHHLPECRDSKTRSLPIPFEDILKADRRSKTTVPAVAREAAADQLMDAALASLG